MTNPDSFLFSPRADGGETRDYLIIVKDDEVKLGVVASFWKEPSGAPAVAIEQLNDLNINERGTLLDRVKKWKDEGKLHKVFLADGLNGISGYLDVEACRSWFHFVDSTENDPIKKEADRIHNLLMDVVDGLGLWKYCSESAQ